MASWGRLMAVVLCAGLALLGLALGAASQREVFLESDLDAAEQAAEGAATNVVPLTALLTGAGGAALFALLSTRPALQRAGPTALLALALYFLVNLAQGGWPNYEAYLEGRTAQLDNSLLAANLRGTPSVLVPVLSTATALVLAILWSGRRLLGGPGPAPTPTHLLRRQVGALALATPTLAIAAAGTLVLLVRLPADEPGVGPYLVLLPAMTLICLALLATGLAKAWQLGVWSRNGRLAASVEDAWQTLGRVDAGLCAVLAGLAVFASFLAPLDLPGLHLGRTFTVTLRGHSQLLVLALLPLVPALTVHRQTRRALSSVAPQTPTLESGTHRLAWAAIALVASSLLLALLVSFTPADALWAWVAAALPLAVLAALACEPRDAAPSALALCFFLWAIGNTISATYDGNQAGELRFTTPAGVLALLRTVATVVGAATATLLLRRLGNAGRGIDLPLAAGAGACAAAIALLQMPLWAWLTPRAGTDALAVGSLLASLDPAVQASIHVVSALLSVAGTLLLARLARPDWFMGRKPPLVAAVRSKTKARPTT